MTSNAHTVDNNRMNQNEHKNVKVSKLCKVAVQ